MSQTFEHKKHFEINDVRPPPRGVGFQQLITDLASVDSIGNRWTMEPVVRVKEVYETSGERR